MADEHAEIEDKYDVGPDFTMPDLTVDPVERIDTASYRLEATYFDTPDGALRRRRITLRRRTGGHDAGWHLKLPADTGRTELAVDSRAPGVPRELSALLLGIRRGQKLVPTVTISTTRISHQLKGADGRLLAEVADDTVRTTAPAPTGGATQAAASSAPETAWHEVEVELGETGDQRLLSCLGKRLVDAGATPSPSASKSGRALGEAAVRDQRPKRLAGLVDDYLQTQYDAIVDGDLALRREVNAIHRTRVAVRRIRSTVKTFGALFDPDAADRLETELVWFAALLGEVRDLDVQRDRLTARIDALPAELVVGPVSARVESTLAADRAKHSERLRKAMNGKRYLALLDLIEQWRTDAPWSEAAAKPRKKAAAYVEKARKKMNRRLERAAEPGSHDELLHAARKAEKRYRYACELAQAVLGTRTELAIDRAKAMQKLLGEFQDGVVACAILRRLGTTAGSTTGENGFTYGLLFAQEWQARETTRAQVVAEYC
jgi:CHAD domain-containing protein